jgi:hypothetical protein
VSQLFGTFSLVEVQGFCRILPDFGGLEQLSIPLNLLLAMGFRFLQQALSTYTNLHSNVVDSKSRGSEVTHTGFSWGG